MEQLQAIRSKLTAGTLPRAEYQKMWGGRGSGKPCAGCDAAVQLEHAEIELQFSGSSVVRFHQPCFYIWDMERREEMLPAGSYTFVYRCAEDQAISEINRPDGRPPDETPACPSCDGSMALTIVHRDY